MNGELRPARSHLFATIVAAFGAFLIVGALLWVTLRVSRPAPVGQARAQERKTVLTQFRQDDTQVLNQNAPLGQAAGFVRLNISNAMTLVQREYQQDAKKARAELVARADKAGTPPPQAAPPPNQYE